MKIEIIPHPAEVIEVSEEILKAMKERLGAPRGETQPTSIIDRDN